jgi:subtilisin family serine protease
MGFVRYGSLLILVLLLVTVAHAQIDISERHQLLDQYIEQLPRQAQEKISSQVQTVQTLNNDEKFNARIAYSNTEETLKKRYLIYTKQDFSRESNNQEKQQLRVAATERVAMQINSPNHVFTQIGVISATLNQNERDILAQNSLIDVIIEEPIMQKFLATSVPLINATASHATQLLNQNLTGMGQTVCVIDTGINYTHPDFGSCATFSQVQSNTTVTKQITTPNFPTNYSNNLNYVYLGNMSILNVDTIQVFFSEFDVESGYDALHIYDKNQNLLASYSGYILNYWSNEFPTDTLHFYFSSDSSVRRKGVNITQARGYVYQNQCPKIPAGHNFVEGNRQIMDYDGHGTHVASIVAANGSIKGVAFDAKLIGVKALDDFGSGYTSDIVAGIYYCADLKEEFNVSVISMSLGGGTYSTYCDSEPGNGLYAHAINYAVGKNISVVVATGNGYSATQIASPACIQNATRVTSSTKADAISSFSDRNALVTLIAPGSSILAANAANSGQISLSGTSMATPHVAGAIAILNQVLTLANEIKTPRQLELLLNQTGVPIFDASSNRNYSRINVGRATQSLLVEYPVLQNLDISIHSPLNRTYTTSEILVNISFTNSIFNDKIWYNVGAENITYAEPTSITLEDGIYTLVVFANNTAGSEFTKNVTFTINTTAPQITITSPQNTTYTQPLIPLELTTDGHDRLWYNFNGTNITYTNQTSFTVLNTTTTLHVWANNSLGTINYTNVTFTVDPTLISQPRIVDRIVSPQILTDLDAYLISFMLHGETKFTLEGVPLTRNITDVNISLFKEDEFLEQLLILTNDSQETIVFNQTLNLNQYVLDNLTTFTLFVNATDENAFSTVQNFTLTLLNVTQSENTRVITNQTTIIANQTNQTQLIIPRNQNVTILLQNTSLVYLNTTFLKNENETDRQIVLLPNINIEKENELIFNISDQTTLNGSTEWNLEFILPQEENTSLFTLSGSTVHTVYKIGANVSLNASQPLRIVFMNASQRSASWTNAVGALTPITRLCNDAYNPTNINQTTRECTIADGADRVVFTYHLSYFALTTQNPTLSGGGGGSSGGSSGGGGGGGGTPSVTAKSTSPSFVIPIQNHEQTYNLTLGSSLNITDTHNQILYQIVMGGFTLDKATVQVRNIASNSTITYTITKDTLAEFEITTNNATYLAQIYIEKFNIRYVLLTLNLEKTSEDVLEEDTSPIAQPTQNSQNVTTQNQDVADITPPKKSFVIHPVELISFIAICALIGCILFYFLRK